MKKYLTRRNIKSSYRTSFLLDICVKIGEDAITAQLEERTAVTSIGVSLVTLSDLDTDL